MGLIAKTITMMLKNVAVVAGIAVLGVLLLTAAFLLPMEPIEDNVSRSVPIIEEQANHPSAEDGAESVVDVFTDSLLLLEASNRIDQPVIVRAMKVWTSRCYVEDPTKSLIAQEGGAANESSVDVPYERYWHGSLVYLKPLLVLFDLGVIRAIGGVLQGLLVLLIVLRLVRLNRPLLALGFVTGYFSVSVVALAQCLQYWPPVFVMLATCLAVLVACEKRKASVRRLSLIFTVSGAVVNYLDLLTFPLVSLAVPLILYFVLEDKIAPVKRAVCRFIFLSLSWFLAYGVMWVLKLLLGSFLTDSNFFTEAIAAAKLRSGISFDPISFSDVFFTNLARYLNNNEIFLILALTLFALTLLCIWVRLDADGSISGHWPEIASFVIPIILASMLVPLWYRIFLQHSFWHPFMTNRDCWIFGFALALGSSRLIELIVDSLNATRRYSGQLQREDLDDAFITSQAVKVIAEEWYKTRSFRERWHLYTSSGSSFASKARIEDLSRFLWIKNVSSSKIEALCDVAISEHDRIHSWAESFAIGIFSIVVAAWFGSANGPASGLEDFVTLVFYFVIINLLLQFPRRVNKWVSFLKSDISIAKVNGIDLP